MTTTASTYNPPARHEFIRSNFLIPFVLPSYFPSIPFPEATSYPRAEIGELIRLHDKYANALRAKVRLDLEKKQTRMFRNSCRWGMDDCTQRMPCKSCLEEIVGTKPCSTQFGDAYAKMGLIDLIKTRGAQLLKEHKLHKTVAVAKVFVKKKLANKRPPLAPQQPPPSPVRLVPVKAPPPTKAPASKAPQSRAIRPQAWATGAAARAKAAAAAAPKKPPPPKAMSGFANWRDAARSKVNPLGAKAALPKPLKAQPPARQRSAKQPQPCHLPS